MNLKALAETIRDQVVATSGLGDGQVVIANQNARAPVGDYLTLKMNGPKTLGGPKGETHAYDENADLGEEITLTTEGPAELAVSLQCFTVDPDGAQDVLERVQSGLQLSTVRGALQSGGFSFIDYGNVQSIPRVYGAAMEGRATLDLRGYCVQSASAKVGYIAEVKGEGQAPIEDVAFDVKLVE